MKDSIIILHLPLAPGCKAAQELAAAGWKNLSNGVYFLRTEESRLPANIRVFSDRFPLGSRKNALQVLSFPAPVETT